MVKDRTYFVYIMTNAGNRVLYAGVTNDLERRVFEHKQGVSDGFTKKYRIDKLVYFEATDDVEAAIAREKQIKAGSRAKKIKLVETENKDWLDLSVGW